jgi:hypothetical protein
MSIHPIEGFPTPLAFALNDQHQKWNDFHHDTLPDVVIADTAGTGSCRDRVH